MHIQANRLLYGLRIDEIFYPITYWANYQSPRAENMLIDANLRDWKLRTHHIRFSPIMYKDSFNTIIEMFRGRLW